MVFVWKKTLKYPVLPRQKWAHLIKERRRYSIFLSLGTFGIPCIVFVLFNWKLRDWIRKWAFFVRTVISDEIIFNDIPFPLIMYSIDRLAWFMETDSWFNYCFSSISKTLVQKNGMCNEAYIALIFL